MVIANYMLSTEHQLVQADPSRWGWGIPTDISTWTEAERAQLASYELGIATLPPGELAEAGLPEPHASWVVNMENGWIENVLKK